MKKARVQTRLFPARNLLHLILPMKTISQHIRESLHIGRSGARAVILTLILSVAAILPLPAATAAAADSDLEIELALSKAETEIGRQVSLTVGISGPSGLSKPIVPNVDGLDIIAAGRTQSVQIINGKVMSSKIFGYKIDPHKTGEFEIGPVQIRRRGKVYSSNTVLLKVVDSIHAPTRAEGFKDVAVEAAVDNARPYVGQQITLLFRFAKKASARIRNAGYQLPELSDFWNEDMEGKREYSQKINGVEYFVTEIAVPLFPIKAGKIRIGKIKFHYDEVIPGERFPVDSPFSTGPFGGSVFDDVFFNKFFGTAKVARRTAYTEPIDLEVRPLPVEGRPQGFKGGVGSFRVKAKLSEKEVKAGESATLTVVLDGQGNIRDVSDPEFSIDGVKIYSDTPSIDVKSYDDKVVGEKVYKLALVPQSADNIEIPGISVPYFNPQNERYEVASSAPLTLKVLPSEEEHLEITGPERPEAEGRRAAKAMRDVLPIHERYGTIERGRFETQWPRLRPVVYPLPIIIYALCFMMARRRQKLRTDIEYRRQRFASKTADGHIDAAVNSAKHGNLEEVFARCSRAVTEYLADNLNIPAGGMTPSDARVSLSERGVPEGFVEEIVKFLEGCDYGRFASPGESAETAARCIEKARRILQRLKREETIRQ